MLKLFIFDKLSDKKNRLKIALQVYIFYKDYQIVSTNVKDLLGRWLEKNRKRHE